MQRKIFLAFVALILIGVLTTGFLTLSLLRGNYIENVKEKLISNSKLIRDFLSRYDVLEISELDNLALDFSKKVNARVTFINEEGQVIGDSAKDLDELNNHKYRPEIQRAYKGEIGISERYSDSLKRSMFYVAIPFEKENEAISVIRLSVALEDISKSNKVLFEYIIVSICAGLLVALILGFRFVRKVTDPIKELTIATKSISNGNYGKRVYYNTDDELGILANNFNIMSQKLEENINEIQDRSTKNKAILTSMINGVIALDNNKRIMFINPAAEKIFGIKEENAKDKFILEVIRNNNLDEQIHRLIKENESSKNEIEIFEPQNRILNIYSNPIKLLDNPNRKIGVVILIQDITEIRKLERMRKDFVANVSHELKTPLTSIKGFVETLKSGAADKKEVRDKFIDIIDIETGRLTTLIQDLLVLSEIENKHNMVNKVKIDVTKSIEEVIQVLDGIAKKKNITIEKNISTDLPIIHGNKTWFKQMVINLVDNGIKYTPEGGKVKISSYVENKNIVIKIKDTGIGIDKEHLTRLFERFYRVDKARSRRVGGTGLGLAIVKHIIIAFNGKIDVKSEVNEGTEFIVKIPID
ncbi:MAG: HAMP domain-containing protein [Firmicutes bacterium]|nr:HAMP domain-containing protein [Bacillota bacterium]